ncbi:MAG: class I SAM-dependent methyltransferase [Kiritimatiellae bacterium]|nr:class I SAM-dependent methyltransferase [Kiritimatiellia bacterium]
MNSNIYNQFAKYYAEEQYSQFGDHMFEQFPLVQERYHLPIHGKLLDVACGNGAFAIKMAKLGWQVTGIDSSAAQLAIADERLMKSDVSVDFHQTDMRELNSEHEFDLVTCWFDSLNYMLTPTDLTTAFNNAYQTLKPGGFYIFDMNTIYGIMVQWQSFGTTLQKSTPTMLEIHRNTCDHEKNIAHLHITIYDREEAITNGAYNWQRIDEIHTERAYPVETIKQWLKVTGFKVLDIFGSIYEFTEPRSDSPRVWFVVRK